MHFDGPLRFDAIVERDLDMLLLEEFCSSQAWSEWFFDKLRTARPELPVLTHLTVQAARSVSGMGSDGKAGETDILVVIRGTAPRGADESIVVLIEDKVSAPFTQDQPSRYADRASIEQRERKCSYRATVLIAPDRYPSGLEANAFDLRLSLEEIRDYFERRTKAFNGELADRMRHRAVLLEHVCHDVHRYNAANVIPHAGNTRTIRNIEDHVERQEPRLRVKRRNVRGRASYGPGFDLPSKRLVCAAAKELGLASKSSELNLNWFLNEGKIRIRFHSWPDFASKLRIWFQDRVTTGVVVDLAPNGKSVDLCIHGLPNLDLANEAQFPLEDVGQWIAETVRLQEWFEELASDLKSWMHGAGS